MPRWSEAGRTRLRGLLDAGAPFGEVRDARHAQETLRSIYGIDDAEAVAETVARRALLDTLTPPQDAKRRICTLAPRVLASDRRG